MLKIVDAVFFPHFSYCCIVWGNMKRGNLNKPFLLNIRQKCYNNWIGCLLQISLGTEQLFLFLQVYMIYFQINYLDIFKYVNEINTKSTILSQSNVLYIRKAKTEYLIRSFTVYRCDLSLRFTCKPFLESL